MTTLADFTMFFNVEFRNELRKKLEIELPPPLKFVAAVACENFN